MEEQRFNKGEVYLNPCELSRKDILRMALESEQECEKLEKENALLRPEAELMDKALDADEKIDIGQAAKILELPYGRNTLFKKLQDAGVFIKGRLRPHQEYIDRGYFVAKEKFIERSAHEGFMVLKILVTQKGLSLLSKLLGVLERRKNIDVKPRKKDGKYFDGPMDMEHPYRASHGVHCRSCGLYGMAHFAHNWCDLCAELSL